MATTDIRSFAGNVRIAGTTNFEDIEVASSLTVASNLFIDNMSTALSAYNLVSINGATGDLMDAGATVYSIIPLYGIIMWSGAVSAIPSNWALCDGTNGTPNLTGKFIVHADADASGTYNVGQTGGSNSVTLAEGELPSHLHTAGTLALSASGVHAHNTQVANSGNHGHNAGTNAGGAHRHNASYNIERYGVNGPNNKTGRDGGSSATNGINNVGNHNHGVNIGGGGDHSHTVTIANSSNHTHTASGSTGATGSGTAHENRPPYYALAYIMRLS
jgi:microcystin-dependent protein